MDRYTANRYIWLKDQISAGGSVPQELLDEVEALDTTVNGDETSEPPVVGLVDVVGDLEETVEDLDIDINGDDTTEPPTPGLKDRVSDIETNINNQTTRGSTVNIATYTTDPYITETDGYVRIGGTTGSIVFDGATLLSAVGSGINVSCYVKKGSKLNVGGSPDSAIFIPLVTNE